MSGEEEPTSTRRAIDDPATRRALRIYSTTTFGWAVPAIVGLLVVGVYFVDDEGNTTPGVTEFVPMGFALVALGAAVFAVMCLWRWALMYSGARRHPWRAVGAFSSECAVGGPNGLPIFELSDGPHAWVLTPTAVVWRWRKLDQPHLLLAARPRRGGMVATPDRRPIVWCGRSIFSTFLVWRRRRRSS